MLRRASPHAGLRAVDLSSDQRPMREDERTRDRAAGGVPSVIIDFWVFP